MAASDDQLKALDERLTRVESVLFNDFKCKEHSGLVEAINGLRDTVKSVRNLNRATFLLLASLCIGAVITLVSTYKGG